MIRENLKILKEQVEQAAQRAGRSASDIRVVLVTKTISADRIKEAYDCGVRVFGENKAQEFLDKYPELPRDIEWHFVGHLQTNKVKYIVDKISLIHSVDSVKLAREIESRSAKQGRQLAILLEVNTTGESSKFGFSPSEVSQAAREIQGFPHLEIKGLMTIGPFVDDEVKIRGAFRLLKKVKKDTESELGISLPELSMGMSQDYEIAIEEGATIIRVGTAVFGERE